ncbi:MAG: CvpA family protein [Desulfovibrio sp.]|nr:CvpA family protein [Desulfovibrio sp.]
MGSDIFDLVIILLLVFFSFGGLKNGFIQEIAGILALLFGFTAANSLHSKLSSYLDFIVNGHLRTILAYILIFVAVMLLVSLVARLLRKILELSCAKWIDNLLGLLLGFAKGLFLCSLLIIVVQTLFAQTAFVQNSHTIPYLSTLIERIKDCMPPDLTQRLGLPAQ